MQLDRSNIERSLLHKGFRREDSDHRFYYFYHEGKRTAIRTKISHGSSYKTYGDDLISKVVRQLHFDSRQQFAGFVQCSFSLSAYRDLLLSKRLI
ncbi:MAG TPA: hypothetical protein PKX74_09020 [Leptospiraceae bacterium]|nr:hypothetical protein [Leptospiraceae bacterium]